MRDAGIGHPLTSPHLSLPVIRAKAVSAKEVDSGNDIYGNPIKRIQYEIKQIKVTGHNGSGGWGMGWPLHQPLMPASAPQMFKGPDQDIEFIYTAPSTAVCGRLLDTGGKKEYLIAGEYCREGSRGASGQCWPGCPMSPARCLMCACSLGTFSPCPSAQATSPWGTPGCVLAVLGSPKPWWEQAEDKPQLPGVTMDSAQ